MPNGYPSGLSPFSFVCLGLKRCPLLLILAKPLSSFLFLRLFIVSAASSLGLLSLVRFCINRTDKI